MEKELKSTAQNRAVDFFCICSKKCLTIGPVFGILTKLSGGVEARPGAAKKVVDKSDEM